MKTAKLFIASACILMIGLVGCSDASLSMDPAQQMEEVEKRVTAAKAALVDSIDKVCQQRLQTEVDSIVNARQKEAEGE
jgi:hypothetical protein